MASTGSWTAQFDPADLKPGAYGQASDTEISQSNGTWVKWASLGAFAKTSPRDYRNQPTG